jgi:hypothetical protein
MGTNTKLVNAWIYLNEDEPEGTNYSSPNSCYQTLIRNNVYQSVNILNVCFVTTVPTGPGTVPPGDGSSYTVQVGAAAHPGGLTNQDYMDDVIRDSRKDNPAIKTAVSLAWGEADVLSRIFGPGREPQKCADEFAANLVSYLQHYGLDGFDIDWEWPISSGTTQTQFKLLVNAIGGAFKKQKDKKYYLTLSPAEVGNLDAAVVNDNMDFLNLQLYYDSALPSLFKSAGVNPKLFAYGAKFESGFQTAQKAFDDNRKHYGYETSTCRSFATISSGLYRFLAITVLLDVKDIPQVGPLQWGRIKNPWAHWRSPMDMMRQG